MNWHPEGKLLHATDGITENVNVSLGTIVIMNLGVVKGHLTLVFNEHLFASEGTLACGVVEHYGVTVFEEVDGGSVGGLDLSHASSIQYACDIATTNRTKSDFFLVTDPTPLLKNANYTTSCSCGGESFFNLS